MEYRTEDAEALQRSELRYRNLVEDTPDGIFVVAPDGRFLDVNSACCQLFGMTHEQVLSQSLADVLIPEERLRLCVELSHFNAGSIVRSEWRIRRNDGSVFVGEIGGHQLPDGNVQAVLHDITKRKQAEVELERMRIMQVEGQRIANLGSFEYIAATKETVWSDEEKRIYGLDPAEPSPTYEVMLRHHIHPEDADEFDRGFRLAFETGSVFENENRIVRPDGDIRWIHNRAHPYFDCHGRLVRYFGATLDITEQKQAKEEIERKNAVLEGINRIFREALSTRTEEELCSFYLAVAEDITGSAFSFMGEIDAGADRLNILAVSERGWRHVKMTKSQSGIPPDGLNIHGVYRLVLNDGKSLIVNTPASCPDNISTPEGHPPLSAFLGVPLKQGTKTTGMVALGNRAGGYRQEDLEAVEALVPAIWQALLSKRAETALRESEERLAGALRAGKLGVYDFDPRSGRIKWGPETYRLWGVKVGSEVTYEVFEAGVHSEDIGIVRATLKRAFAATGGRRFECEFRVINRADGIVRWVYSDGDATFADNEAVRLVGTVRDITAHKEAEQLAAADLDAMTRLQRLGSLFVREDDLEPVLGEILDAAIAIAGADFGSVQLLDPARGDLRIVAQRGFPQWWLDYWNAVAKGQGACGTALERGERIIVADVERSPIFAGTPALAIQLRADVRAVQSTPLIGRAGKPLGMISTHYKAPHQSSERVLRLTDLLARQAADIIERKRAEEQVHLLMREVNHRAKNMLSLVLAIAQQTVAANHEDFIDRFSERIHALAASQDLLVKGEWKGVNLRDLVASQLAHFGDLLDSRITMSDLPLKVSTRAAQAIGMALHELATNAGKYGALSNDGGCVKITWGIEQSAGEAADFVMSWRERGGPAAKAPSRRGFGSFVVRNMIEASLDATVSLDFADKGLTWRVHCPANAVADGYNTRPSGNASFALAGTGKAGPGTKPRVLIVEDEPIVALDIANTLKHAGFDIVGPAGNLAQALDLLRGSGCDMAVLDIKLGEETSEPVARELAKRATPFVTLSAYSQEQQLPAFRGAPALTKPLRSELLVAEIGRCIDARQSENGTQ